MSQAQVYSISDTSNVSGILTQAQQEFKDNYFDFQNGSWRLINDNIFSYDGKGGRRDPRTDFFKKKADAFNEQFTGAKVPKFIRFTEERVNTLYHLFKEFLHQFELGQVDICGYVRTSFAHLSKEARLESSAFRKRILGKASVRSFAKSKPETHGHLLRNNIIQIKNIVKSTDCSVKNGFHYTTFEYRINPEYMPFIDDKTRQVWKELSLWKDAPTVKIDIANAPTQAKYEEKRQNAIKTRAHIESIFGSDQEQLFEELYEMNARQQDAFFQNKRRALGIYASKKDCDKLGNLIRQFLEYSNAKTNIFRGIFYTKTSEDTQIENRFGEYDAQDLGDRSQAEMPKKEKNVLQGFQTLGDIFQTSAPEPARKKLTDRQLLILGMIVKSKNLDNLYGRHLTEKEFHFLREDLPLLAINKNLLHQLLASHYDWIWKVEMQT